MYFEAACRAVGGEARRVVLKVCSAFKEEAGVVSEQDIVKAEASRGCPPVLRVFPPGRGNNSFVTFEGDPASSVSTWTVSPRDEDAGFVDDVWLKKNNPYLR